MAPAAISASNAENDGGPRESVKHFPFSCSAIFSGYDEQLKKGASEARGGGARTAGGQIRQQLSECRQKILRPVLPHPVDSCVCFVLEIILVEVTAQEENEL